MPVREVEYDDVMLLLRIASDAGGRIEPERFLARVDTSTARRAYLAAVKQGYMNFNGEVTPKGTSVLEAW